MNIVLIGPRGSGKTTVGKLLSKKLKRPFIETDDLVEKYSGMSIAQIVQRKGWGCFRNCESGVIKDLNNVKKSIIATGGGVVLKKENMQILKTDGFLIYLKARADTLVNRIGNDPNRPSLTGKPVKDDIHQTLRERHRLYQQAADVKINTDNRTPAEIVKIILHFNNIYH